MKGSVLTRGRFQFCCRFTARESVGVELLEKRPEMCHFDQAHSLLCTSCQFRAFWAYSLKAVMLCTCIGTILHSSTSSVVIRHMVSFRTKTTDRPYLQHGCFARTVQVTCRCQSSSGEVCPCHGEGGSGLPFPHSFHVPDKVIVVLSNSRCVRVIWPQLRSEMARERRYNSSVSASFPWLE